jgi:hypothetical protein
MQPIPAALRIVGRLCFSHANAEECYQICQTLPGTDLAGSLSQLKYKAAGRAANPNGGLLVGRRDAIPVPALSFLGAYHVPKPKGREAR